VPTDTGVGTLSDEVPLGLLGHVALADEGPNGLIDDRRLEKACRGTPFGRGASGADRGRSHSGPMTIELSDRCCQGLLFVPDLLCTAAD
jgi:hypothetical protein